MRVNAVTFGPISTPFTGCFVRKERRLFSIASAAISPESDPHRLLALGKRLGDAWEKPSSNRY